MKRKIVAGAAAAVAVSGAGAGIAATQFSSSPSQESQAVITDAAKKLGVQPNELSSALKKALEDRVDAAVAAGRIPKNEGDRLKRMIESNNFPLFAGPGFGFGLGHGFVHHMHGLDAAASYLGLTEEQLEQKLESGKTLAQVAKDQGKSVDGLVATLKADLKSKLDDAVSAGRLTKAEEVQILKDADQRINAFVNGKLLRPPPLRGGFFGERHGFDDGPHAAFPGA